MNKNTFKTVKLTKGEVHVYDFGKIKLHAYKTNDFLADEVFIFEKNNVCVVLEPPCFYDNISELTQYLSDKAVAGIIVSYHGAGASFLPDAPKYSTENAVEYSKAGGGKALIDNFASAFGALFDNSVIHIDNIIGAGKVNIGGVDFIITLTHDAFDLEIPEINAVYTHMLGHDCHSIVAGAEHADAIITQLKNYIGRGVGFILTSHYTAEDLKDAQTKIEYLETLKSVAAECKTAEEFKEKIKKLYGEYGGENYLEMTASMFFKN
ncbi:MAG: hypothetical protein K2L42_01890 [Clostridia bacterium]|nr:hypothetical protein [Clostridia bacterium]